MGFISNKWGHQLTRLLGFTFGSGGAIKKTGNLSAGAGCRMVGPSRRTWQGQALSGARKGDPISWVFATRAETA